MRKYHIKTAVSKTAVLFIFCLISFLPGKAAIVSFSKIADGVIFKLDKGLMDINICTADIIEVKYTLLNTFPVKQSLVVNNPWMKKVPFSVDERDGQVIITTATLMISVSKATNAISYADLKGNIITSESAGKQKHESRNHSRDRHLQLYTLLLIRRLIEALFGLGCHPEDTLSINYKGRDQSLLIKLYDRCHTRDALDKRLWLIMG